MKLRPIQRSKVVFCLVAAVARVKGAHYVLTGDTSAVGATPPPAQTRWRRPHPSRRPARCPSARRRPRYAGHDAQRNARQPHFEQDTAPHERLVAGGRRQQLHLHEHIAPMGGAVPAVLERHQRPPSPCCPRPARWQRPHPSRRPEMLIRLGQRFAKQRLPERAIWPTRPPALIDSVLSDVVRKEAGSCAACSIELPGLDSCETNSSDCLHAAEVGIAVVFTGERHTRRRCLSIDQGKISKSTPKSQKSTCQQKKH